MRRFRCLFFALSRRSICRGLMRSNCFSISGLTWNRLRIQGIHNGSSAFNRTDQGYPAASQTDARIATT